MTKTQLINFGNELAALNVRQPLTMAQIRKLLMYGTYKYGIYDNSAPKKHPNKDVFHFSLTIEVPFATESANQEANHSQLSIEWIFQYMDGVLTISSDHNAKYHNAYPNGTKELKQIWDLMREAVANQAQHAANTPIPQEFIVFRDDITYRFSFGGSGSRFPNCATRGTFMDVLANNWERLMVKNFPPVDPQTFDNYNQPHSLPRLIREFQTIAVALRTAPINPAQATKDEWVRKFVKLQGEMGQLLYDEMIVATHYRYRNVYTRETLLKYHNNRTNQERSQQSPTGLFVLDESGFALPITINTPNPISDTIPTLVQEIDIVIQGLTKIYQETLPRK